MNHSHWTLDSWGSDYPPENAAEIVERANALIDAYAATHDEDATAHYSEWLWELYTCVLYKEIPGPYVFCDLRGDEEFLETYDTEQEALDAADMKWYHLTPRERNGRAQFFVGYAPVTREFYDVSCGGWNGSYEREIRDWLSDDETR